LIGRDVARAYRFASSGIFAAGLAAAALAFCPGAADAVPVPASAIRHVGNTLRWQLYETRPIPQSTIHRPDVSIPPGTSKVVAKGAPGERRVLVSFVQSVNGGIQAHVISSQVIRAPHPRIVVQGAVKSNEFRAFARRGIVKTALIAASALRVVATAYTADCSGCSGITAIGRPAGHGIVAVDPRVIPLGTRLYIPGYGVAVAGDTGGAIHGDRIDLGFDSAGDAMRFGRREVTIYRLK
jgi:3D (Asp-Asp-Asp) domain-containing protein